MNLATKHSVDQLLFKMNENREIFSGSAACLSLSFHPIWKIQHIYLSRIAGGSQMGSDSIQITRDVTLYETGSEL